MAFMIHQNYHHNWILDNLPAAAKSEDEIYATTIFVQGPPVGFVNYEYDGMTYINNHVNMEIWYSKSLEKDDNDTYNIVQFVVEPFSIAHEFEQVTNTDGKHVTRIVNASCKRQQEININDNLMQEAQEHKSWELWPKTEMQKASGQVLYTYDVIWRDIHEKYRCKGDQCDAWSERWDAYLWTKHGWLQRVQRLFLRRKSLVLVLLGAALVLLVKPTWRRRYCSCCCRCTCCWQRDRYKGITPYVFLPPVHKPAVLAALCGTGAQILVTALVFMVVDGTGLVNPAMRGWDVMLWVTVFPLCGVMAGYVSGRLQKTFGTMGSEKALATLLTAFGFPTVCAIFFILLQIVTKSQNSTLVVPFWVWLVLAAGWLGLSPYLVLIGARWGCQQESLIPAALMAVSQSQSPREIPKQPLYAWPIWTIPLAGLIPYGMSIVELRCFMPTLWKGYAYVYYFYKFFFSDAIVCFTATALVTLFFVRSQLSRENYRWWWRAFLHGGGAAGWMVIYSFTYFRTLQTRSFAASMYYFAFMILFCFAFFMVLGFVGLAASLTWNLSLYKSVKMERGDYELVNVGEKSLIGSRPVEEENKNTGPTTLVNESVVRVEEDPSTNLDKVIARVATIEDENSTSVPLLAA